jgi:heme-degrading monooxygenase HmoA
MFAKTPNPPYYAVVFSTLKSGCNDGYEAMAKKMTALASKQAGFLGLESAKNELGITISYWRDLKSIQAWKENAEHMEAQGKR